MAKAEMKTETKELDHKRGAARLKAWTNGGAKFINYGNPTPHRAWVSAFNLGFDAGYEAGKADLEAENARLTDIAVNAMGLMADIRILYANDINGKTWEDLRQRMDALLDANDDLVCLALEREEAL